MKTLFVFASSSDVGNYTISLILKDENPVPKTTQYEFDIFIVGNNKDSLESLDSLDKLFPEFYF